MYVITFYSFKGGVGRTMALANVGIELARTGRRVLLVDFDLEAPGLDTFDLLKPSSPTRGIVDFVTTYQETGSAPDVAEFVYKAEIPLEGTGGVWVMPTGKQDEQYASKLYSIDWQQLYSEQEGYILFEDLKQQWNRAIRADYVLIDSRTGHTDVGGICTRQLPDAVAVLFFPNEQNRRGIEAVVRNVRREKQDSKRSIALYFIASDVPNLDDEESILSDRLDHFRQTLGYNCLDGTLHHYDSLALLQQTIFTLGRRHTRLAREYRQVAERLISDNFGDRLLVIATLARVSKGIGEGLLSQTTAQLDAKLKRIRNQYNQDGEVLYLLAQAHQFLGNRELAQTLFIEARALGFQSSDALIQEAVVSYTTGLREEGRRKLTEAVRQSAQHVIMLERALSTASKHDIEFLPELVESLDPTAITPQERIRLSKAIATDERALNAVDRLLTPIVSSRDDAAANLVSARYELALCRIAQKRFGAAMELMAPNRGLLSESDIGMTFNYAMAEWGSVGRFPKDLFHRVLSLHETSPRDPGANYYQCIAISHWAVGRYSDALSFLNLARQALLGEDERIFSAWRYLWVAPETFQRDLDCLETMITGGSTKPLIFT